MTDFNYSLDNSSVGAISKQFQREELISDSEREIIQLVFGIVLLTPVSVLGITGNISSFIVLRSQKNKTATNYCLIALAVSDILLLVNALLFALINIYVYDSPREGTNFRLRLFPVFGLYTSLVTARVTSLLTTLLSIERFVAVNFPMKAKLICNKTITLFSIIFIYGITIVLFLPFPFKYNVVYKVRNNETFVGLQRNPNLSDSFCNAYGLAMNILFRFSPIIIILVFNIKIMTAIKKTHKSRESIRSRNDGQSKEQGRITIMLLVVSFTFVLGILPGAVNSLLQMAWPGYSRVGKSRNFQQSFSYITFLLEAINSALNFLIYMALSARFRAKYKEIFYSTKNFIRQVSLNSFHRDKSSSGTRRKSQSSFTYSDDGTHQRLFNSNRFRRNDSCKSLLEHSGNNRQNKGKSDNKIHRPYNGTLSDLIEDSGSGNDKLDDYRYQELKRLGSDLTCIAKLENRTKQSALTKQDTLETDLIGQ